MMRIAQSIEVTEPVSVAYEQWMRFEQVPVPAVDEIEAHLRWRSEVLTFEPRGEGTRVTLRIDYEPSESDGELTARLRGALEDFRAFLESGGQRRRPADFPARC